MKYMRLTMTAIVVVLAAGAIAATGAMAEAPEYGRCEKVAKPYDGGFANSKCTSKSETKTGKYEWHPGAIKAGQTSSGGKGTLEEVGKYAVACVSESSTGQYSGTKEGKDIIVKFKKCESGPFTCTTEGHEKGELETKPLAGRLVWENEKTKKTAIDHIRKKVNSSSNSTAKANYPSR